MCLTFDLYCMLWQLYYVAGQLELLDVHEKQIVSDRDSIRTTPPPDVSI